MQTLPINTAAMDFTFLAIVPKLDQNQVQARNKDNVPKWEIQLLMSSEAERRPEVLALTLTTNTPPELVAMTPVQVENLIARHWENNGRSGIAFSADQVRPSGKAHKPPAPSTNGNKPEMVGAPA